MVKIISDNFIDEGSLTFSAIRAQGAGGQNVNKVSSAIHLRFDINASSLSDDQKEKLINTNDQRISKEGIVIIKAQKFRTQEKNRQDAIERLVVLIQTACKEQKKRRPTKPTKSSQRKRLEKKTQRSQVKSLRGRVID